MIRNSIFKAKESETTLGFPESSQYKTITEVVKRYKPKIKPKIVKAIKSLRESTNESQLKESLIALNTPQAIDSINFLGLTNDLEDLDDILRDGIEFSGNFQAKTFAKVLAAAVGSYLLLRRAGPKEEVQIGGINVPSPSTNSGEFSFKPDSSKINSFINQRILGISFGITNESKAAISTYLSRSFLEPTPRRNLVSEIKNVIGLNERQANAVFNFRRNLESKNFVALSPAQTQFIARKPKDVDALVGAYSDRLLSQRAETIANTETAFIASKGQTELWDQASEAGLFDKTLSLKEWVVTPHDKLCGFCEPLSGIRIPLNEDFQSGLGSAPYPPLHPNCLCAVNLIIGG